MRIRDRSILITLTQGLTQVTTIILGIVLVRLISKELLGTYRQVTLVYGFLLGFLGFQLESSLFYFMPSLEKKLWRKLLGQTALIILATSILIAGCMLIGAVPISNLFNNPKLAELLRIYCLYAFSDGVLRLIFPFMINIDRPVRGVIYSTISSIVRIIATISTIMLGGSLVNVMWNLVIIHSLVVLIGWLDMARLCPAGKWGIDRGLIFEQIHYAWPLWLAAAIGIANMNLDRFLISSYFDSATYAVYSCGAMELPVIALFTSSLNTAIMPNLVNLCKHGKIQDGLLLWQEAVRKSCLFILPCFVFFFFTSRDFIILLYGKDYAMAAWPFSIYLLELPLRVAIYGTLFRALGQTRPISVGAILTFIINVIISVVLLYIGRRSLLSFIGPAIGTICATYCVVAYYLWRLKGISGIPIRQIMRWGELGRVMLICILSGLVLFVIPWPAFPLFIKLGLQATVFGAALIMILLLTKTLNADETELLQLPFRRINSFLQRKYLG